MKFQQIRYLYLVILALIWGSSFILIKRGLIGLSPLQVAPLRIIFAAVFLICIGFKNLPLIPFSQWKYIALTALLGTFVPAFLFAIAQTEIDSSVSSILNSLTPVNTLLIGSLAFGYQFKRAQILGVIGGLLGTAVLIFNGLLNHPEQNYYYAILLVIATLCYATNVNLINKYLTNLSPLTISVGNFIVLLLPAVILLFLTGFLQQVHEVETQTSVFFIMILGVFGTGIANIIFFKIIQISNPVFATSVTYLIPIVAFFWGILDKEVLTFFQIIGACIIFLGVYLSSKK